jgi:tetratricopeptide (TPR) repeat protein/2-polyprenyl-3-methyl-5-hydroxy-6-metoxy-1,4-benzoquinol methylase
MKPPKGKGVGKSGRTPANPVPAQIFSLGLRHHQAGELQQAQTLYNQALAVDPNHAPSLHYLGLVALQTGYADAAAELIGRSIVQDARDPESHYHLGLAFRALGRTDQMIWHWHRAIVLKPDYADAHLNLGSALKQQGKLDDAAASFRRIAHLRRDSADAHFNLADVFAEQGRLKDAVASYKRTLALDPDHTQALNNFGAVLTRLGRSGEAISYFQRAVQSAPGVPDSYLNLARALLAEGRVYDACGVINHTFETGVAHGRIEDALDLLRRALEIEESRDTKTLFVQCLRTLRSVPEIPYLRGLLIRAFEEPWGRPSDLAPIASDLLKQNTAISAAIERSAAAWPGRLTIQELFGDAGFAPVTDDVLLRTLLQSTFIRDMALERFLTNLRTALLEIVSGESLEPDDQAILTFCCALARQCFINEYVFDAAGAEIPRAAALREGLAAALRSRTDISPFSLAVAAMYGPLHALSGAQSLLQRDWSGPVRDLLLQQVAEPAQEREIGAQLSAWTAINDDVSRAVQQQYEENPYPRWVKAAPIGRAMQLDAYLGSKFQNAVFHPLGKTQVEILVAGCGTGQHSTLLAQQFPDARLLALDLSRASLGYAARMTHAIGLTNIEYRQADILELGSLGRSFDVVDSSGVLHHLADPLAGWRVLLSLLRPGGVMRLGLYSALGRQDIEVVRTFVREQGHRPTAEDIRAARQQLAGFPPGTPQRIISEASDFFSMSECRDLLFHLQEHSFTLPEIKEFLDAERLRFLGFETSAGVLQLYARKFPRDAAMNDLSRWHVVETENSRIFFNMYQFWVQKPA